MAENNKKQVTTPAAPSGQTASVTNSSAAKSAAKVATKTASGLEILPIKIDEKKIEEALKQDENTRIVSLTSLRVMRLGSTIRNEPFKEHKVITFDQLREKPRYLMRKHNLFHWFVLTDEEKKAYQQTTVNECLRMDLHENGGVVPGLNKPKL